ncbi:MAG: phospholipase D-like domain-containing protein [Candidatus Paceibacterota bacterium]
MESKRSGIRFSSKKIIIYGAIAIVLIFIGVFIGHKFSGSPKQNNVRVIYSLDKMQNDQEIINIINGADKYIYFAIYMFTKDNIADALIDAKNRGVIVQGITDRENAKDSYEKPIIEKLKSAGIIVENELHQDGIMHIKTIVSEKAFASGSYNWTSSATVANDEVLEVGTDESLRSQYENILKRILEINKGVNASVSTKVVDYSKIIDFKEASNHIGESISVQGKVIDIYKSAKGLTFFDYCSSYKNCPFSVVIFSDKISNFKNLSTYIGKTILVSGTIKPYNGKAEMILNTESQIKIQK